MRALVLFGIVAFIALASVANAGDVVAIAKGGKLVVKGSPDGDELMIDLAGADLRLSPGGATTLNGFFTPATFTVTAGITIDLGDGDDFLTFTGVTLPADLRVKLGDGFDTFRSSNASVVGAVTLDLGPGAGSVALCDGGVGGALTVKSGTAGTGAAETECQGVDNSEIAATDGFAIALGNFNVGGDVAVKLKAGAAKVVLANSGGAGKGKFTFGDGATFLGLCDAGFGGNVGIAMKGGTATGQLHCELGTAGSSAGGQHGVILAGAQIGGSVTVKGGKNEDVVVTNESGVNQKLKLALSDGENTVIMTATLVGESFGLTAGKGYDFVSTTLTVGESAKMSLGDGGSAVDLGTSIIGEDLTIKTGKDADTITTNQTTVGGTKTIKPGGGSNTVQ